MRNIWPAKHFADTAITPTFDNMERGLRQEKSLPAHVSLPCCGLEALFMGAYFGKQEGWRGDTLPPAAGMANNTNEEKKSTCGKLVSSNSAFQIMSGHFRQKKSLRQEERQQQGLSSPG